MKLFPPFRLDALNQCVWREDARIPLTPKMYSVLRHLVEHPGRLVTQDELLEAVWPDTYVQPEILRKYILEIRKALGDDPKNPRFIQTFPKRGYQFVAEVTDAETEPPETRPPAAAGEVALNAQAEIVGRRDVMRDLAATLEKSFGGQRQTLFLSGEAGIGKSTVVDAFQALAGLRRGLRIARGQCVEGFGGKEAYYPLLEAIGQMIRGASPEEVLRVLAVQAPTWLVQFPSAVRPEQRETLQREIFGATRERMVREICEALESLTAENPLLLTIEDAHWVDPSTLDVLSALARRRSPAKLFVLVTYRPVEVILLNSPLKALKQELVVHRLARELSLERLSEADIADYLAAQNPGGSLPDGLASLIHQNSEGNPLFMTAIVAELMESGLLASAPEGWRLLKPLSEIKLGVPDTLQQMLELQVDQLNPAEQQVLQCASIAGRRFSAWAVAAMAGEDLTATEEICENLARRQQFLRPGRSEHVLGASQSAHYEFRHALYRHALYRRIPSSHRSMLHRMLATKAEQLYGKQAAEIASELAQHFEKGRENLRAAHYLLQSARNAARKYAHRDAIQILRHALDLIAGMEAEAKHDLECDILEGISDAHYALGEMQASAEVDGKAAALSAERNRKVTQIDALTRAARALSFLDPDDCVAVCDAAASVSATLGDPLLEARTAMLAACWRIVNNGWTRRDHEMCEASRKKIHALQGPELPAYFEILYAHVQSLSGEYIDSLEIADAGLKKATETHSLVVYLSSLSSKSLALIHLGRWGELRRALEHGIDLASKNGNEPWAGIFRSMLAWLHTQSCDFEGARSLAAELLSKYAEEPPGQIQCMALLTLGYSLLARGEAHAALKALVRVRDRTPKPRVFLQWYWKMISEFGIVGALLESGEVDNAAAAAERFLKETENTADPALRSPAWDALACVAAAKGDLTRALECSGRAVTEMNGFALPSVAWRVRGTAAALNARAGKLREAREHLKKSDEALNVVASSFEAEDPLRKSLLRAAENLKMKLQSEFEVARVARPGDGAEA